MSVPELGFRMEAPASATGPRRAALLVHGLTGAPAEMRYLAKRLNKDGFTVSVPLLAGHGTTSADLLATNWRDWLATLTAEYDALAAEVDEVHVAGICLGGLLGIALAHARPGVASVAAYSVMLAPDGWGNARWIKWTHPVYPLYGLPGLRSIQAAEEEPYGIKNPRLRARIAQTLDTEIEGALPAFPCGAVVHQYRLGEHVMRVAPKLKTPVLLLHAVEDDKCTPRNAARLAARLPRGELRILHDSYHMIHVDQERGEVAAMTSRFFRGLPVAAPTPAGPAAAAVVPARELSDG